MTVEADPASQMSYNFKYNQDKLIYENLILFEVWYLQAHGIKEKM
jgi:hypothetical protein